MFSFSRRNLMRWLSLPLPRRRRLPDRRGRLLQRLELEPLEDRTLMAASILGSVWNDLNGNALRDGAEAGVPGITLFLDQNGNGTLDSSVVQSPAGSTALAPSPLGTSVPFTTMQVSGLA